MDQDSADTIRFAPADVRARHDGWSPEAQRDFIDVLADTGCVSAAAKAVGMTTRSAYRLRRDPRATSFSAAWEEALDRGIQRLEDVAILRAIEGTVEPIFYHGEQVGERRRYDHRLLAMVLGRRQQRLAALQPTPARDSMQNEIDFCRALAEAYHDPVE